MPIDRLINVLVTVTLFEMMVAIGLGVTFADLVGVAKSGTSPWLLGSDTPAAVSYHAQPTQVAHTSAVSF